MSLALQLRPDVTSVTEKPTAEMYPGVPVIPAARTGATDSRFMRNAGIPMYRACSSSLVTPCLSDGRAFMYRIVKVLTQYGRKSCMPAGDWHPGLGPCSYIPDFRSSSRNCCTAWKSCIRFFSIMMVWVPSPISV